VKLTTKLRNLAHEAALFSLFSNPELPNRDINRDIFLYCHNSADPRYLVLEDAGENLRCVYGADVDFRTTTIIPKIIEALYYLHQFGIMHGDLKPRIFL